MIKEVYAYVRVSTLKQGEGVSLHVQKDVIEEWAKRHGYKIIKWFTETRSASKGERPAFGKMVADLYDKKANGCIFHKVDRISRNDLDWHTMNMLADAGYDIISASENLNLRDNASRFTADIQAVVASNYSRNLSFEAKKGLYGRLKQGYYPFYAPIGYINTGKGKIKTVDKKKAPMVKLIFELYTQKGYSVSQIVERLKKEKLRNKNDKFLPKNSVITILKNPFYKGLMLVKGDLYEGNHKPLISSKVFDKAQQIMAGKANCRVYKHNYLFRRIVRCENCNYMLVGERQKGNVYYRCHKKNCPVTAIREETLSHFVRNFFMAVELRNEDIERFSFLMNAERATWKEKKKQLISSLNLRLGQYESRLDKLTDTLIDGDIDKIAYQKKRKKLLNEQLEIKEEKERMEADNPKKFDAVAYFLELLNKLVNTYDLANHDEKQELLKNTFSNLVSDGKKLVIPMFSPLSVFANRDLLKLCAGNQTTPRTNFVLMTNKSSAIIPRKLSDEELQLLFEQVLESCTLPNLK